MELEEMRELPPAELKSEAEKLEAKIWKSRFQSRSEPVENSGQLTELKKERARLLTVLREKDIGRTGEVESRSATGSKGSREGAGTTKSSGPNGED